MLSLSQYEHKKEIFQIEQTLKSTYQDSSNFGANYLKNRCIQTSHFIHQINPNLTPVAGFIEYEWHAWNYDTKNQIIVDLSAWQFEQFKKGEYIYKPNDKRFKQTKGETIELRQKLTYNRNEIKNELEILLETHSFLHNT